MSPDQTRWQRYLRMARHPLGWARDVWAWRRFSREIDRHRAAAVDRDRKVATLIANLRERADVLRALNDEMSDHWHYEDAVYRFWHHSWKVYRAQDQTLRIVEALQDLLPEQPLHPWFQQIVAAGTGKQWDRSHNAAWLKNAKPVVDAFLHARYALDMATRYCQEFDTEPEIMPSGWAALLTLYQLR